MSPKAIPNLRFERPSLANPLGLRKDNPAGCGIQTWKNPTKAILSALDRNFFASEQVRLLFNPRSLFLEDSETEIEFDNGRFISRAFRNAGYASLTIPPEARWLSETRLTLKHLLELGEEEKVNQLKETLASSSLGFILERLSPGTSVDPLIPGEFKHYCDREKYERVLREGMIQGTRRVKNRVDDYYVSLTRLSLSYKQVGEILFTIDEMRERPGRGSYVIAFNIPEGSPMVVEHLGSDRAVEVWVRGNLYLTDVNLTYYGANPL